MLARVRLDAESMYRILYVTIYSTSISWTTAAIEGRVYTHIR